MTQPGPDRRQVSAQPSYPVFPPTPPRAIPFQRQPEPPAPQARNGFGITALVLAVIGIVFGFVPLTGFIAFICGAIAVLFGVLGIARVNKRQATNRGMAIAGTALGGLAVLLGIWGMVITFQAVDRLGKDLGVLGSGASGPTPRLGAPAQPAAPTLLPGQIGGDGSYEVGTEIQPGTYRTNGPSAIGFGNCYWERSKDTSGELGAVITNDNVQGPATVTIKPTDGGFKSIGCQPWSKVR